MPCLNLLSFGDGSTHGPRGSFPVLFLSKACSVIRSTMLGLAEPRRTEMRKRAAKVVNARRKWRFCIVYKRICTDLDIFICLILWKRITNIETFGFVHYLSGLS